MATITNPGRGIWGELNQALQSETSGVYIPFEDLDTLSLLMRRAKRYANRMEAACSYEWAQGDQWEQANNRLEASIRDLAEAIPGIAGVIFTGDPRGYTVRLMLANGAYNTWGGAEDGWGIA